MLIFYIICACLIFAISGLIFHFNRLAIYRRRIIRHFSHQVDDAPFVLSEQQEKQIKACFLKAMSIQKCIDKLEPEIINKNKNQNDNKN